MRKLLMAICVVISAIAAQAATAKWSASNIYQPGSTTDKASGYLVYFVQSADYSLAKAQADVAADSLAFLSTYGVLGTTQASGASAGTVGTTFGNGETVTGYLVILDNSSLADATYAYVTGEASKATGASGQQATIAFGSLIATQTAGNWTAVNVPEPTSGLMLILGIAGLALKRKRA
jgi:uncharacterized protein YdbL (DUF1318 family)